MHTPEDVRVESGLKFVEGSVVRRTVDLPGHYSNRLVGQGRVDDVGRLDQQESVVGSDGHLIMSDLATSHQFDDAFELTMDLFPLRLPGQSLSGAGQCLLQAHRLNGFQQIVHCVDLKRFDGVLIVRRHEDQGQSWGPTIEQSTCHLKASQAGHLDIEENQRWLVMLNGGEGFQAVAGLGHHFHIGELAKLKAQFVARQLFIVHHQHTQGGGAPGALVLEPGIRILMP
jgi:hypothetical protein